MLEPQWRDYHCVDRLLMPPRLRDWIFDQESMTQRQEQERGETVVVTVLRHDWQLPRPSESQLLHLKPRERAIVREVNLVCGQMPYMFARSVFPLCTLLGKGRGLRKLGARPLGDWAFEIETLKRMPFQIAQLKPRHQDYQAAAKLLAVPPPYFWARRSVFYLVPKQPILVSEVFLPEIYEYNQG